MPYQTFNLAQKLLQRDKQKGNKLDDNAYGNDANESETNNQNLNISKLCLSEIF